MRALRDGKNIYVIDDHASSHEMAGMILDSSFPGRISGDTDARRGLENVAGLASTGQADVLILDMDMPGFSGRDVLTELARRNIFIPTVIFSGVQGVGESRRLLSQICAAKSFQIIEDSVTQYMDKRGNLPLVYVAKEDAAYRPKLLEAAVDAMIIAGRDRVVNLDLLLQQITLTPGNAPFSSEIRRVVLASTADMIMKNITRARLLKERLERYMEENPISDEQRGILQDIVESLDFYPDDFSFETLDQLELETGEKEWRYLAHRFMGSSGCSTAWTMAENYAKTYSDKAGIPPSYSDLQRDLFAFLNGARDDFFDAGEEMDCLFVGSVSVSGLLEYERQTDFFEIDNQEGEDVSISGSPTRLRMALKQAITNAQQAVIGKENGFVRVKYGKKRMEDLPDEVEKHFASFGPAADIVYIKVSDNGGGIPEDILQNWRNKGKIISRKTGQEAKGLNLMRELIEVFNQGTVEIITSETGTEVEFYFLSGLPDNEEQLDGNKP